MSREHLRTPLLDESHVECIYCGGNGKIRSRESLSLTILREIYKKASTGNISEIQVALSPDAAKYLLNNKRTELYNIEQQFSTKILISGETITPTDNYRLECSPKR